MVVADNEGTDREIYALIPRDGSIGIRFVDLTTGTCTCEGFEKARCCSHLKAVEQEAADRSRWEWEAREAEQADFLKA